MFEEGGILAEAKSKVRKSDVTFSNCERLSGYCFALLSDR